MRSRVSPNDRIRHHIDELFAAKSSLSEILEEVARLRGVRNPALSYFRGHQLSCSAMMSHE